MRLCIFLKIQQEKSVVLSLPFWQKIGSYRKSVHACWGNTTIPENAQIRLELFLKNLLNNGTV
jgi:hypothetical protein